MYITIAEYNVDYIIFINAYLFYFIMMFTFMALRLLYIKDKSFDKLKYIM